MNNSIVSCIQPGVYVGNAAAAADAQILRREKIRNVVSVWTGRPPEKLYRDLGIVYKNFPIKDSRTFIDPEGRLSTEIFPWIEISKSVYEESTLVHCKMGISRSPAFVITYLVWGGMPFESALKLVIETHPITQPSLDVMETFLKCIGIHVPNLVEILIKNRERASREIRSRRL